MTVHVYRARDQPATRYRVELAVGHSITIRTRRLSRLHTMCCKRVRIAGNCVAHVYYDGVYFFCRKGCGCKA